MVGGRLALWYAGPMQRAEYDAIENTLARATMVGGAIGAVGSALVGAMLANQTGRAVSWSLPLGAVAGGVAGYGYARYRITAGVAGLKDKLGL